jgi:hypothetical protein
MTWFADERDTTDTGDEDYWLECRACLTRHQLPDTWEWTG